MVVSIHQPRERTVMTRGRANTGVRRWNKHRHLRNDLNGVAGTFVAMPFHPYRVTLYA